MTHEKLIVVQMVRKPLGGIRKHILSIIEDLEGEEDFDWYIVTHMDGADQGFQQFLEKNPEYRNRIFPLTIKTLPHFGDFINILKLFKFLKNKRVRILHGHGAKGGLYARVLSRFIGAKAIYTPHGGSLHNMFGTLKKKLYIAIEKMLLPLTDLCILESQYSMKQFRQQVSQKTDKLLLNKNGIQSPQQFPPTPEFPKPNTLVKIGAFGALRKVKGHDIALRALKILKQKNINCSFEVFGDGEEQAPLIQLAEQLEVGHLFKIHNCVRDVAREMSRMDIIIQPSRFESFGYVPLEAMSLSRPVIASRVGGLVEVVKDQESGLLCPALPEDFAIAIEKLIVDQSLRQKLIEGGQKSVKEDFSEAKMLNTLKEKYRELSKLSR